MGHKADLNAFSTDTYHFHAKQSSKCWELHASGEQLEQTVVMGEGDIAALPALFSFTGLL